MAKRLQASERRASILAVAKVLFADKGYHGVSVDEIAVRLAVSPAVLYRHFSSKQDLYEAVLSEIACKRENYVDVVVRGPDDFGGMLAKMTLMYVESVARDPDYLRMELHAALEGSQARASSSRTAGVRLPTTSSSASANCARKAMRSASTRASLR